MKRLNELIECGYDTSIYGIKSFSKDIKPGDLFVAVHGFNCDHHDFIDDAINRGASAIVSERKIETNIPVVLVPNTNKALTKLCHNFYDNVEEKLDFIGVTGTDGKTTTTTIIYNILKDTLSCANMGTNGLFYKDFHEALDNTTPEFEKLYDKLYNLNKLGCKTLAMEVSSEALLHKRVENLKYKVAILTNITGDHMNIHKTMDNYIDAKGKLFQRVKKDGYCILNNDDKYVSNIKKYCQGTIYTYGKSEESDFRIHSIIEKDNMTSFTISYQEKLYNLATHLKGEYNIYNVTAAFICCYLLGLEPVYIEEKILNIKTIIGRGERLNFGQNYDIILDYAHTANAIENILTQLQREGYKRIITVTGSAGGREKEKRSKMGKAVLDLSDYVIFTMDDPRYEKVSDIINDLISDSTKTNYEKIEDRKRAIFKALDMAQEKDAVAILGKGRDNYMAIESKKVPYCDYEVIEEYFKNN